VLVLLVASLPAALSQRSPAGAGDGPDLLSSLALQAGGAAGVLQAQPLAVPDGRAAMQCPSDDYEPNGSFAQAYAISAGTQYTAYICPSGDEDWFKFFVQGG
jgi:hypothetical protein